MDLETVSVWADIAAIFLVAQLVLFTLVVALGLGAGWWYLRKGRRKLVMPFLYAQMYALRVQQATLRVSDAVAGVPIGIHATAERARVTAQIFFRAPQTKKD